MKRPALHDQPTRVPTEVDENAIPVRTAKAQGCPLGPLERMVLDRVDGRRRACDLAALIGLGTKEGTAVLSRLVELGAIEFAPALEVSLEDGWDESDDPKTTPPKGTE